MNSLFADWRFLVFAATMIFNVGAIWAQWTASRRDFRDLKQDVKDLKVKVLNGITDKLGEHTDRLTRIEVTCSAHRASLTKATPPGYPYPQRRAGDPGHGLPTDH